MNRICAQRRFDPSEHRQHERSAAVRHPTNANSIAWQHSLRVLINRADYQIGGGVALRLRTQAPPLWLAAVNFRAMSGSAAVSQNRPQGDVASSSPANPSLLITMLAAIAEFERELSTDERAAQAGDGRPPTVRPGSFVAAHPFARPTDPIARLARTREEGPCEGSGQAIDTSSPSTGVRRLRI